MSFACVRFEKLYRLRFVCFAFYAFFVGRKKRVTIDGAKFNGHLLF